MTLPNPLLDGVHPIDAIQARKKMREFSLDPGVTIFREGDRGGEVCCILEGTVDIVRDGRVVDQSGAGEVIGEASAPIRRGGWVHVHNLRSRRG